MQEGGGGGLEYHLLAYRLQHSPTWPSAALLNAAADTRRHLHKVAIMLHSIQLGEGLIIIVFGCLVRSHE